MAIRSGDLNRLTGQYPGTLTERTVTNGATNNNKGFSLIELLVVIAMIGILAASSFPTIRSSVFKNTVNSEVRKIRTGLKIARDTSITQSITTKICAGTEAGCGGAYTDSWIVYTDAANDGWTAGTDKIVRVFEGVNSSITITASAGDPGFDAQGFAIAANSLKFCHASNDDEFGRFLNISASGVVSVSFDSDNDAIHNSGAHSQGSNVSCP